MLDFARIKEIKLTDVLARYKIPLRFKGEYAVCSCPLPTHKQGDNSKSFSITLAGNYWRCFSDSCNANNGGKKGGDVINFVALMDGCREKDAAQKLADWYGVGQNKTPTHMEQGSESHREKPVKDSLDSTPASDSVKPLAEPPGKYMEQVDAWFKEAIERRDGETEEALRKRLLNQIKKLLIESYRNGKRA
jgi:hypothetical protein